MSGSTDLSTFSLSQSGTREEYWRSLLPRVSAKPLDIEEFSRLVVVSAHPDDETLMAGGLIATAAGSIPIEVLVASDGEASHPDSPTYTPLDLAHLRRREVCEAISLLAPDARVHMLGFPDGRLSEHCEETTAAIVNVIGADGASTAVVSTWRGDRHPDHAAVSRAAAAAVWRTDATHFEAPLWLWHWGTPADLAALAQSGRMYIFEMDAQALASKREAVTVHRSQTQPLGPEPGNERLLSPKVLAHFDRRQETFYRNAVDEGSHFEPLHRMSKDPWETRSSWYEARKRAITLAALPARRYGTALEVGCSVGALAEDLAARCDRVVAIDESEAALDRARQAVLRENVRFEQCRVPEEWPWIGGHAGPDLIVVSEMGYFLSPERMRRLGWRIRASKTTTLLACHWRHEIAGWPLDAQSVHRILDETVGMSRTVELEDPDFQLVVWSHADEDGALSC